MRKLKIDNANVSFGATLKFDIQYSTHIESISTRVVAGRTRVSGGGSVTRANHKPYIELMIQNNGTAPIHCEIHATQRRSGNKRIIENTRVTKIYDVEPGYAKVDKLTTSYEEWKGLYIDKVYVWSGEEGAQHQTFEQPALDLIDNPKTLRGLETRSSILDWFARLVVGSILLVVFVIVVGFAYVGWSWWQKGQKQTYQANAAVVEANRANKRAYVGELEQNIALLDADLKMYAYAKENPGSKEAKELEAAWLKRRAGFGTHTRNADYMVGKTLEEYLDIQINISERSISRLKSQMD